ncbi:MAG TPA: hypothetical protein VJM31_02605 [Vicinamibacterales bacterium]|nr:hypothetical protein [Vicinamibacterales bacterium]
MPASQPPPPVKPLSVEQRREVEIRGAIRSTGNTVETTNQGLTKALNEAKLRPTADNYRLVAALYRGLGIRDRAYDYLTLAIQRAPKSAQAFQERAEIWRDWHMPQRGLADALMAIYLAPRSASAHSSLGTIWRAIGDASSARVEFERAVALDPGSAYALNNLCYLSFLEGNQAQAQIECERALAIAPDFVAARNNLALSYAARGDMGRARAEFLRASDPGSTDFNLGIVYMSIGEYSKAVEAFRAASQADPSLVGPASRLARQATVIAESSGQSHGTDTIR